MIAADDRQKWAGPFFTAVGGRGFDRLHRFAVQIARTLLRETEKVLGDKMGDVLKVFF